MTAGATDQDFDRAVGLHRAGDLDRAAAIYEAIVAARPDHFGARHLLGVIASQKGDFARGAELIKGAVALDPRHPAAQVNLGNALMGAGDAAGAEAAYRRATELRAGIPEAWFGLGNALAAQPGRTGDAAAAFARAISLRPDFVEAIANLADLDSARGALDEARAGWDRAIALRPEAVLPRLGLARTLAAQERTEEAAAVFAQLAALPGATPDEIFAAGNGLAHLRRHAEAAECYRTVLARMPGSFPALNNLGNMLREQGKLDEAEAAYRDALALHPDDAAIVCNRALILKEMLRVAEAEAECRRSLALAPTAVGHSNLGLILNFRGRHEEALEHFRAAARLAPSFADFEFHEGVTLLHLGRLAEGWPKYEARWGRQRAMEARRHGDKPQWRGEPVAGKTVLIHAEQGFGDTLMFVRYAPLLARRGARVILECQPALARLMADVEGVAQTAPRGAALPEFDLQCPTMSLPLAFGTTLESIPHRVPYVAADPAMAKEWAAALAAHKRPRVGLVWAGDARHYDFECHMTDRRRSLPLAAFASLLADTRARFFSLQIGPAAEQAKDVPALIDLTGTIRDFADTAALIANLDLVISVDTSVAHLAGAMGKPVWVLSRFDNCWRWLRDRADSPWYPTLTLYRQPAPDTWQPALDALAADFARWTASHSR